jgi:hypothetical protein
VWQTGKRQGQRNLAGMAGVGMSVENKINHDENIKKTIFFDFGVYSNIF